MWWLFFLLKDLGLQIQPVNSVNGTFETYVSNEQDPGCLGFTGDYDNKIHYKDPIWMFPKEWYPQIIHFK